eukprot:TRINITY_DN8687_c0_g1_i1.p1 TRINITY_DN8687_c0_g1~~TRINITY_DN8687_c0_g1_i1.p1  ORF type:complete len:489 (+),score=101.45 TRINITY_DN8687_c0_g1_i1:96-1562(+)
MFASSLVTIWAEVGKGDVITPKLRKSFKGSDHLSSTRTTDHMWAALITTMSMFTTLYQQLGVNTNNNPSNLANRVKNEVSPAVPTIRFAVEEFTHDGFTALDVVRGSTPASLFIDNPFPIPESVPGWNQDTERLPGTIDDFVKQYRETNVLTEKFKVPIYENWFFHSMTTSEVESACIESEVLCQALRFSENPRFVTGTGNKIPKMIHQSARIAHDPTQPHMNESISSFTTMNPDYLHLLWTDHDVDAMVRNCYPHLYSLFQAIPVPVMRADWFRYLTIHKFGGVYGDVDTICLKPIDTWLAMESESELKGKKVDSNLEVDAILGLESDLLYLYEHGEPGRPLENMLYTHPAQIVQFVFVGAPHSEFSRGLVFNTTQNLIYYMALDQESRTQLHNELKRIVVLKTTGPGVVSGVVHDILNSRSNLDWSDLTSLTKPVTAGHLRIHPITAFQNLVDMNFMGQGDYTHPQALVRHMFAGSWKRTSSVGFA